jgi:hypothetical protein
MNGIQPAHGWAGSRAARNRQESTRRNAFGQGFHKGQARPFRLAAPEQRGGGSGVNGAERALSGEGCNGSERSGSPLPSRVVSV